MALEPPFHSQAEPPGEKWNAAAHGPAALFVAHPGHELRVHGWLEVARPSVHVLTDGSGSTARPRVDSTRAVLQRAGARPGNIFGRLTDRAAYAAVLGGDADLFVDLARELAASLVRDRIATVVGDAREGYNPIHDVTRSVIDAAVRMARGQGRAVRNLDFLVVGLDETEAPDRPFPSVRLELDGEALARKLEAARGFRELDAEVAALLARRGTAIFAVEHLRPVATDPLRALDPDPPAYEPFGEARVAAGLYERVLRYADHVRPLLEAIERRSQP
jgi:hypothetical protein